MFNNASNVDVSHSTFNEVHRDQYIYSRTHVQGNQSVNTIVHGNQVFQGTFGLESLHRASVSGAAFDSFDRHPAPTCLPGTRLELLAHLTDWVDDPKSDQRICWLTGPAGSGKSAIAQSIAEKYATQRRLVASFFFSRKEILRRKAQGFFPTIACQMLVFAPFIRPALVDALNADATVPTKVLVEQARSLLQQPIASSTSSFPHSILIVVDSLDECDDVNMADEIVRLLAGILCRCRWPLKVLFTSRAEPHIVQTFQHSELRHMTRSIRLQDFGVIDDIRAYLRHSFQTIQETMNPMFVTTNSFPWPSEDEIEVIVQRADGLFIFATTVIKHITVDYASPVAQLQAVLQALHGGASAQSSLVHSSLDMLYLDALRTILDVEKVRLILGSVVFAYRPLSICGLNDLLWEFSFDATYIVKKLSSVLVIADSDIETDGAVRIYHTSFRDFLTSPHRSHQYFVDPLFFHGLLARACLELMNRHLTGDMCNVGDPSLLNCEIKNLDKRCKLCIKEGVRYACRWFAHHLSQIPWDRRTDDTLVPILRGFASRRLLNWIEVLSLIGELDNAVLSLRDAADWLKCSPTPCEETLSLFRDAERLVLMCYDAIQQSALQVYYCLPCAPTRVQIRTTYADNLKNKFTITHGLDDHWKLCFRSVSTGSIVRSLAISASGRLIASAGDTPGVQLWDALTGNNTGHLPGNGTSTCSVMFSPSGEYVAIGYNTGGVDMWDVSTGQQLLDPSQGSHNTSVTVLAFSPNNLFIASGAEDATIHVWDLSSRGLKQSFSYQNGPISCLLFSFDGGLIASGSNDTSITTSGVYSGQLVRRFRGHTSKVNCISFSPDDGRIASGSDDHSVRLWDTRTGVCLQTFTGAHKKPIRQVWITADNGHIVSVCNMDIYMWETSSPKRKSFRHIWSVNHYFRKLATMFPAWYAKAVLLLPASVFGRIAEIDDDTALYAIPSPDGKALGCTRGSSVLFLEFSAPQRKLSKLRAILSATEQPPLFVDDSDDLSTSIAMTLDTTMLATSVDNGMIKLWNTSPRNNWKTFQDLFKRTVDEFWPAPDGHSLLIKRLAGLQLLISRGTVIKDLETGGDILGQVGAVPSPDSRYFAYWAEYTWNTDKSFSIHIYNASTGVRLTRIPGFFDITCGRFSAESEFFACTHGKGLVQVWELPSVLCRTTITTEHAAITALEFLPGNISLAVGSDEGYVEIRLVENGDIVHRVQCSPSKVLTLAVPDEAFIAIIGHEDGSVFVWDPSYANLAPHCLLLKALEDLCNTADTPDGINFIKFTGGYRSLCTRSVKGVICTWDLTRCLEEYAQRGQDASVENAVASERRAHLADADALADTLANVAIPDTSVDADARAVPTDSPSTASTLLVPDHATSEPTPAQPSPKARTSVPDTPATCPHLVLRSEAHIVYDRYVGSTYAVDNVQGWVYRGSTRLFWLPGDLRPESPTAFSALDDRLVILVRSRTIVILDLRSMLDRPPPVGSWKGET